MRRAYVDFETYYSADYTLSKMTPAEYIRDPRFETLGAACAYDDERFVWLEEDELAQWLKSMEDEPTIVFSHNALFDATIMSWRYGINPALWGDTLSMSRGVFNGTLRRFGLAAVAQHLGFPPKGTTVQNMKGYTLAQLRMNPALYAEAQVYACHDGELCRQIEQHIRPSFPLDEYLVIDTLIRCVTEPALKLDMAAVYVHLADIQARKAELLQAVALDTPASLMSNQQFAAALDRLGVEPPMKISKTTGKETYAFAKTDAAMEELSEHENPLVQALVAARLGHKSTQEETRSQRFLNVAHACEQWMVMPLRYSGAHTHRFSGDWKMNVQNLGRNSKLRSALVAPPGMKVVSVDASQIEARLGAWLADWTWLLDQFRDPAQDPYSNYAGQNIYHRKITKADKLERFIGKQSLLSLQYGASWRAFQRMCRVVGGINITEAEARVFVVTYRVAARPIKNYWQKCGSMIASMAAGDMVTHKCLFTRKNEMRLPSGLSLNYPGLHFEKVHFDKFAEHTAYGSNLLQEFSGWRYGDTNINLFGGKLMENECQALARIIVTNAGNNIRKKYGLKYKLQVHDELVYVVPDADAERVRDAVVAELSTTPGWAPGLPLAAEGGIGQSYGDCK